MRRSVPAGVHRAGASRTCHPGRYAALPSPDPIHNFRSYLRRLWSSCLPCLIIQMIRPDRSESVWTDGTPQREQARSVWSHPGQQVSIGKISDPVVDEAPDEKSGDCPRRMSVSVSVHQPVPDRTLAVWMDSAPDLTCIDSTQAHCVDAEHQPTDLAVGGSNPSRRARPQGQQPEGLFAGDTGSDERRAPRCRGRQAPIGHLGLLFQRRCQLGGELFSDLFRVASLRGSGADGYMVAWTGWVPPVTVSSPSRRDSWQAAQTVNGWKSAPQVCWRQWARRRGCSSGRPIP